MLQLLPGNTALAGLAVASAWSCTAAVRKTTAHRPLCGTAVLLCSLNRAYTLADESAEPTFVDVLTVPCSGTGNSTVLFVTSATGSSGAYQEARSRCQSAHWPTAQHPPALVRLGPPMPQLHPTSLQQRFQVTSLLLLLLLRPMQQHLLLPQLRRAVPAWQGLQVLLLWCCPQQQQQPCLHCRRALKGATDGNEVWESAQG
ncbi:hypothetical protein COO60DRAFT_538814 [Scenedesmus sp. NREL 46B-D3]|nr:hypothetical protein COO60DRAFT_538814 [Scenedesmus sp. NREL 46B-D3]